MALNNVTLTGTLGASAAFAQATFTPSNWLTDVTDQVLEPPAPVPAHMDSTGHFSVSLLATDNTGPLPAGWTWTVTFTGITGVTPYSFSFLLPFASGATQDISAIAPVQPASAMAAYLPLTGGTMTGPLTLNGTPALVIAAGAAAGKLLTSNASGNASWATTLPAASAGFAPASPATTTSTTQVMMGLGSTVQYTPRASGVVIISLTGVMVAPTASTSAIVGGRYGTVAGGVPINGAAMTGTVYGAATDPELRVSNVSAVSGTPFAITARLALTAGTAYWFDLALASTIGGDAVGPTALSFTIAEQFG